MSTTNATKPTGVIHAFRLNGYKTRLTHYRNVTDHLGQAKLVRLTKDFKKTLKNTQSEILPKGGETVLEITTPKGAEFTTSAKCSKVDAFNRRLGIKICVNRLLSKIEKRNKTLASIIRKNS